jgi:phage gp29-like protein
MMPDDRVSKCLETLYSATTLPLTFLLPGKDSKESANDPCVQALDGDWWKMLPEQKFRTVVAWIGLANACLCHIDGWELDEETGRRIPVITVWSLRHLRADQQKGLTVRYASNSTDSWGVEEQIVPGDGNWVLLLAGDSWKCIAQARGHQVAMFWLLKQYAIVDWALSSERHGGGINVARSTGEGADKLKKPERIALANDMAAMARNGNLVLPHGWIYELVTDDANSYTTFEAQIKVADSGNVIGILGTNLTTEVTGGSRAAASVHESVDAGRMRGLLELLATGFRQQVLVYWARYNGAAWIAPYSKWDTTPPTDKKGQSEARKADAEALLKYREAGLQLNQKAWVEGRVELLKTATDEFPAFERAASPTTGLGTGAAAKAALARARARSEARPEGEVSDALSRGKAYVDDVEDSLRGSAAKTLAPTLAGILSAIEDSEDFDDAKARMFALYKEELPPSKLLKLTEAALIMTQLAGRESIEQELEED